MLAAPATVSLTAAGDALLPALSALAAEVRGAIVDEAGLASGSHSGGSATTTLAAFTGVDGSGSNAASNTITKNAVASLAAELALIKADVAVLYAALAANA